MTTTILFLWTVVGSAGTQFSVFKEHDWRPMGEFASQVDCRRAAAQLALSPEKFKCIDTGKKP